MKEPILSIVIVISCFALPLISPFSAISAAENTESLPVEMDGTEWAIEIVSVDEKGEKNLDRDTIIFKENKFSSKKYGAKGYAPTSYSLTVRENGTISFGTMQIKDKETVFWRGNVNGEKIEGSIHVQYPSGNNMRYRYTGQLSKRILG